MKKQELVVNMNQDSQMKDMRNNILSSINSLKNEILNLKEIIIKNLQNENEIDRNVRNLRDIVQSRSLTVMLWYSMVAEIM